MTPAEMVDRIESACAALDRVQKALGFAAGCLRRADTHPPGALYLATAETELARARELSFPAGSRRPGHHAGAPLVTAAVVAATLRACCAVLCEDCRTETPGDCYRNLEREWWHRGSEMECDASALRDELDRMGTILGALVMTYECPTCGALYAEAQPVPCCADCDPERFS